MLRESQSEADLQRKFEKFASDTLYPHLPETSQIVIRDLFLRFKLSFQELRQLANAERDLSMWEEPSLESWWRDVGSELAHEAQKARFLIAFWKWFEGIRGKEKTYAKGRRDPCVQKTPIIERISSDKTISGLCPVASQDTICCQLRTIDAVETCPFSCTYCTIQTFYSGTARFDADFGRKLSQVVLDPERFYHYGSGQSSDSLVWGNRFGIMDDLLSFADSNPNVLLELKTKCTDVDVLLNHRVPGNVVCSWSLNTDTIVKNEEVDTPLPASRLSAAREVADSGTKVAFHFHPMIWYSGWHEEYRDLAIDVMQKFESDEVLFVSFGSVTLIKPVIKALRRWGGKSKILQMPMARDPKGKVTYPDEIKIALFNNMIEAFAPWQGDVFFYLCMEKPTIWNEVFGFTYDSNEAFEREFGRSTMSRLL